ncbi:MAG TPA: hypothetical protein VLD67_18020 [Vicinamibacterales bacterium]|nr:hypothetical protein [Vicinamibacterales bacterium]
MREATTAAIVNTVNVPAPVPQALARRVEQAVVRGAGAGATRLRTPGSPRQAWRPAVWSAGAVVAATLVAILFLVPLFKGPTTVSAAEILARSAGRLAERVTTGVEYLEYELTLDGIPREMMPDHPDGSYRVKQIIDHDTPGRYYLATYAPDGRVLTAVAQDPATHRRVMSLLVEDQPFRFEVSLPEKPTLSLPEMERMHMQASVAMMQASGNQQLQVIEMGGERLYLIEVPSVSGQTLNDIWDLSEARVLIDATDYHIVEFAVKGTFLKQPYSVSYRLISRTVAAQMDVPAGEFDVPADGSAIRIDGDGSAVPLRDALVLALRELARLKQAR